MKERVGFVRVNLESPAKALFSVFKGPALDIHQPQLIVRVSIARIDGGGLQLTLEVLACGQTVTHGTDVAAKHLVAEIQQPRRGEEIEQVAGDGDQHGRRSRRHKARDRCGGGLAQPDAHHGGEHGRGQDKKEGEPGRLEDNDARAADESAPPERRDRQLGRRPGEQEPGQNRHEIAKNDGEPAAQMAKGGQQQDADGHKHRAHHDDGFEAGGEEAGIHLSQSITVSSFGGIWVSRVEVGLLDGEAIFVSLGEVRAGADG